MKNLSAETKEKVEELLQSVVKHFDSEDRIVREYQLRKIRRLKLYWNSFSQIYWSETARDYRIFGNDAANNDGLDQAYYDKPVNVFRAFLETIIAAMSIQIPAARCVPDDANNPNDIATAKAGNVISELLYKHNDVLYLWLYALYVHMTEGMVACYSYIKEDKAYGVYSEKQYKDEKEEAYQCDECGQILPEEMFEDIAAEEQSEFMPDDDDISLHSELNDNKNVCPNCAAILDPQLEKKQVTIPKFVGMTDKPKSRVCFKVKGGMFVKIAVYAKEQCETPYLIDSYETHYANALQMYPKLWEKIAHGGYSSTGVNEPYEWWVRINPQYRNAFPEEVVTVKNAWLRPAAFNILEEDQAKLLKKHFPDGARVIMVNEYVADYENESLDDCWTVTRNPMFDYLTHEPLGELLVNVQDITNDLISLTLQTIEHGIPQTWVDPQVVDLDGYKQTEAAPGTLTPIKPGRAVGQNISDAFHSTQSSSLSPEVFQFYQIMQQLGQFVSGAMPSIYGGQMGKGSSGTASEYAMARTNALQRLSTPWRMFTMWWKDIMGKGIPAYMKVVQEDERLVKKDPNGNYVNVWIRKADLVGKIGDVELENSEQMPVSDDQKADIIMRLMELNNMEIMQALTTPENLPFIRKVVKIPEFKLPGEDDRNKQYEEINELLNSEPIVQPQDPIIEGVAAAQGIQMEPQELPSVEVDPFLDNHAIEGEICRNWLISDAGRLAKIEQPLGYKNVLLHYKQHIQLLAQSQMANQAMQTGQETSGQPEKPNDQANPDKPIEENKDVRTPVE